MSATQTENQGVDQRQPEEEDAWLGFVSNLFSQRDGEKINTNLLLAVSRDRLLAQACENRELAAAQMDEDWLGVKLLAYLRESPDSQASELALMTGAPIDAVTPILARLARAGAVAVRSRQFACTEKGVELLRNLEAATGISLIP